MGLRGVHLGCGDVGCKVVRVCVGGAGVGCGRVLSGGLATTHFNLNPNNEEKYRNLFYKIYLSLIKFFTTLYTLKILLL